MKKKVSKSARNEKDKIKVEKYFVLNLKLRAVANPIDILPTEYAKLFAEFYRSEIRSPSSKVKEGMLITMAEQVMAVGPNIFYGQFVEFTNLDNMRWFDVLKKEIDSSFSVPENYKANVHKTNYFFFPSIHRFAYKISTGNNINPYNAREFLLGSFQKFLDKSYPQQYLVQIDVETTSEAVKRILNANRIFSLSIRINYSNAGFGNAMTRFVENDLKPTNLEEIDIKVKSKKGSDIDISQSKILKGSLALAESNGTAVAQIENDAGKRETINTVQHPNKVLVPVSEKEPIKSIFRFFTRLFHHGN